jgi:hypothetical protein
MKVAVLSAALALTALPSSAPSAEPTVGWVYSETTDPITDARRGFATLGNDAAGSVVFKCDANGPGSVYAAVIPALPFVGPSAGSRKVVIRVDGGPAREDVWMYGRSQAVKMSRASLERVPTFGGAPSTLGMSVDDLAAQLAPAKAIVLRVMDFNFVPVDVVLGSNGDPAAVKRVYATCADVWPTGQTQHP